LLLALFALPAALSAQNVPLELGKTIQGDLPGGQAHSYSVRLEANQYLRAEVTQAVAAAVIELYTPDGKKALAVNARDFPGKTSRVVWVAESAGEYRISVSVPGKTADASHYEIRLEELRAAVADDRKSLEAERFFTQGLGEARKYAYDQAVLSYTRALGLYRELRDREREGDALHAAGTVYRKLGQYEKAIGCYEQALAIRREVKDRGSESRTLGNLGTAYYELSQYEKAIGYYEQALAISREIKDRNGEGAALQGLGGAYSGLSQNEKAVGYFEQALASSREIKDRPGQGKALGGLGVSHMRLGQDQEAIAYYIQALAIQREIGDRLDEGWSLIDIGTTYGDLGDYHNSIGYYEQALAIEREIKNRLGEAQALMNLGWSYSNLKQYEKAIGYSEQALVIAREIKDRQDEGEALNVLGIAYNGLRQNEKAVGYQEQALAIFREIKDRLSEAWAISNLGNVNFELRQYEKATGYYQQALAISREAKDRGAEAGEFAGLMEAWQASGKPRLAIFYGKQAVNTVQSLRSDIAGLSQDIKQSFLKENEKPYHTLAEILIAQGRLAEAEQVLALLKEEEYFQYIRRDAGEASSLNRRADLTPEEAEYEKRYRDIGDRLMTIGVERGELLAKKTLTPEQSQRLDQLEQDLAAGNQAFGHFLGDLTQHFSAKPEMTGRIEDLRETQGIMEDLRDLPAGTVAIFTLIADDKLYTILRTPDAQKKYEYPIKAADLNRKILEFHQVVQDPELDPRPLAHELYKILIGGMADDLRLAKAQTLMWELDGPLRYVPLAALYDGKQYLIEQYRVSVMTLASKSRLKDPPAREWQAAGFGVTKGFEDAAALPSVSSELAGIITTMPGDGGVLAGEIKLDDRFTEQSMRDTLHKRYPVIHIASHFRFQPGDDAKSFLLLGDGGHLTLAELKTWANLFGGVQLLTLSACNTGVGDGAEVEGFGALAQIQGAKAVVASLWPVADASTSRLMQEFYRIRESPAGVTKLEALREAQLALLRGAVQIEPAQERSRGVVVNQASSGAARPEAPSFPISARAPYAHPYYWAPFFLMGNWL
jgi:CHAT domain-containing protein/Tfp pilus assembly protein PilF